VFVYRSGMKDSSQSPHLFPRKGTEPSKKRRHFTSPQGSPHIVPLTKTVIEASRGSK
jgi:hypothetical protein